MRTLLRNTALSLPLALVVATVIITGCTTPSTTRTGAIHDITIEESLSPLDLAVGIGDEVRWVNHRTLPVSIDLVGVSRGRTVCQHGFTNLVGMMRESTTIGPSESVSLCFANSGVVTYNVRMESALPGGKKIVAGTIKVGGTGN